jgi:hypothetical protein
MPNLPQDRSKPFTVNGVKFINRDAYDKRVRDDLRKMADFLYDIYQDKKRKEKRKSLTQKS